MSTFLASIYLWLKAFHIIMVIAWFAGLMYLPRLFVYHHQSAPGGEAETYFTQMERRLARGIMNPSMMAVWVLAGLMLIANPGLFSTGWFHVKLVLVLGVTGVHVFYLRAQRRFEAGERVRSEKFWRMINEAPFVMMIGVAILAVLKPF